MIEQVFLPGGLAFEPIDGMTRLWETSVKAVDLGGAIPRICHGMAGDVVGTVFLIDADERSTILSFLDQLHEVGASDFVRTIAATSAGPAHAWHWTGGAHAENPLAIDAEAGHANDTN
jgi:gamma-glutamylcyclotransferase (GGCT)/AIG2-like uncharacterized protein YtfP